MYGQLGPMYSPQMYPGAGGAQLAPQGFLGHLLGQFGGPAGQAIGGLFSQPQVGGQIGQALGGLGHLLPFQAAPIPVPTMWGGQQPGYGGGQFVPQGFLGHLFGQFGGPAGQAIGGLFSQPQIGGQIGQALGGLGHLLPFQAAPIPVPTMWGGQQPGYGGGQFVPQGFLGHLLGQFGGPAGQAIGGLFSQPQVGGQIGQALGGLGHLLPFQAAPWPIQQQALPGSMVPPYPYSPLPYSPQPWQSTPGMMPVA